MDVVEGRWQPEQVFALAPRPTSIAAAQPLAVPGKWVATGCDEHGVWGRCVGGGTEPYEVVANHVRMRMRCTCPSRVRPCKHVLALLLLWARGQVAHAAPPRYAEQWLQGWATADDAPTAPPQPAPSTSSPSATAAPQRDGGPALAAPPVPPDPSGRDERVARMMAGLAELDRWLDDRMRTGLADPALAQYRTWDQLAARLVDAQVGALANRVRRLAGLVGAHPDWHQQVLAEMGMLHLLADAGRHVGTLSADLADAVALAVGWQVRQADVLAGVPHTDHWAVMGRSDVREDRIEVRRVWLRGRSTGRWAMVLSFAAYRQTLDDSFTVGTTVHADLFRYPGVLALRALAGSRHAAPQPALDVAPQSVSSAAAAIGNSVVLEPWIERLPVCVLAAPARSAGRWVLTDDGGALPMVAGAPGIAALLACSEGRPVPITAEWTPNGLVPLTVHLPDRAVDIGPVADPSFVGATA